MNVDVLRLYKPDGKMLQFRVGAKTTEGKITEIEVFSDDKDRMTFALITYSNGTKAYFEGFPAAYAVLKN